MYYKFCHEYTVKHFLKGREEVSVVAFHSKEEVGYGNGFCIAVRNSTIDESKKLLS